MNSAAEQRAANATQKARGGASRTNKHNNQPVGPRNNAIIQAGRGGCRGEYERKVKNKENERDHDDDGDAKEKGAARFSSPDLFL